MTAQNAAKISAFLFAVGFVWLFAAAPWLLPLVKSVPAFMLTVLACWSASLTFGLIAGIKGRRWAYIFAALSAVIMAIQLFALFARE